MELLGRNDGAIFRTPWRQSHKRTCQRRSCLHILSHCDPQRTSQSLPQYGPNILNFGIQYSMHIVGCRNLSHDPRPSSLSPQTLVQFMGKAEGWDLVSAVRTMQSLRFGAKHSDLRSNVRLGYSSFLTPTLMTGAAISVRPKYRNSDFGEPSRLTPILARIEGSSWRCRRQQGAQTRQRWRRCATC